MKRKRVVVTGMGLVSCFGTDVKAFYEKLLQGESGVKLIEGFPCEEYPTRFAGEITGFDPGEYIEKKLARRLDPYARYGIVAGKKALEMAGLLASESLEKLDRKRCGVLIGSGMGGMDVFAEGCNTIATKGYKRLTPFFVPFIITNMAGALLAIDVGFMGPNYSISTACATSNYCIYNAAEHILKGDADVMVCGGAEASISPVGLSGFVAIGALSQRNEEYQKASRPWDKNRDGFVMGEGSGVLVLESLEHALKRGATIYGEYIGGGLSCDAHHMTDPRADGLGVKLCIEQAIAQAGIDKEEINYINAHATSTLVGDLCEVRAVKDIFGSHASQIKMNATKSMTGHCLGAAGGIEAIATLMAIQTGKIHPTINLDDPEEELDGIDPVRGVAKSHKIQVALSNSFGFGGHNSCLLFREYLA